MNAAPADQRRLLEVADLDARLTQAEGTRRNPPQGVRVQELIAQRQTLSHELAQRQGAVEDLQAELARVEADVRVVEARRARDTELLQKTSSPKDAAGLEHELASLQRRQRELEDAELELMERIEEATAAVGEQRALIDATNEEGARLSAEAKAIVSEASTLIEQLSRDRAAVATAIPADLLALYDRLSARGNGAALLRARTCLGCHMMLSGTDLASLRQTPPERIANCPECGCILVRDAESGL